ncbi:hypothetical protein Hypma_009834 [Hypsizygus marmoreus]|uniref:Ricin B lectin domain-containing protein n=1 Tax=Hypsizygus marmoreus TaxID=39966 RepID=A0A369JNW5_HYPMA|nr:hypothetical protein Hypma_009834 [Hypsizygus marmoreus]
MAQPIIPNGKYAITHHNGQGPRLTLQDHAEDAIVTIVSPTEDPAQQEWEVELKSDSDITIKSVKYGTYLSYSDTPYANEIVTGQKEPREWQLRPTSEALIFDIIVPGGPVDGNELALDLSLLKIFPPRAALRPWKSSGLDQGWYFKAIHNE